MDGPRIALKVNDRDNVATIFANGIHNGSEVELRDKKGFVETLTVHGEIPYGPVSYTHLDVYKRQAFVTPPVALNLFVGSSMTGLSIDKIVRAFMPFLIGLIVAFFIVSFVPAISLGVLGDWSLTFG